MCEKKKSDIFVLADGIEMCSNSIKTQINNNVLVAGGSGSGKTLSYAIPRLLGCYEESLIVTTTKEMVRRLTENMFLKRGYKVLRLNWANPETSNVFWNPLKYITCWEDVTKFGMDIIMSNPGRKNAGDPYWNECAASLLCAIISMVLMTKENPDMVDVIKLYHRLKIVNTDADFVETSLDAMFSQLETKVGSQHYAIGCWRTVSVMPPRTYRCIQGTLSVALDKIFTERVLKVLSPGKDREELDIKSIGKEKTVLYMNTSPVNSSLFCLCNLFYSSVFKILFEEAQNNPDGTEKLDRHVHILCDDFAVGSPIPGLENYISVIRAANISVSLLIQSEAQLETIYGDSNKARTIIDNCDTYIFLGGMDKTTARNISERVELPMSRVLYMKIGKEILMQRGQEPKVFIDRYKTLEDERYQRLAEDLKHINSTVP